MLVQEILSEVISETAPFNLASFEEAFISGPNRVLAERSRQPHP